MKSEKNKRIVEDENFVEYYPSTCCELLHVTNATLATVILQTLSLVSLSITYFYLERSKFINTTDLVRPAVIFLITINTIGIVSASAGIYLKKHSLISVQITILTCLVIFADLVAFISVAIMAFGNKFVDNSKGYHNVKTIQSYFVNEVLFEAILGPFWIYLIAILFHLGACTLVCFIGVHRKYQKFLIVKYANKF